MVITAGERGRSIGKLDLTLNGKGAWVNANESEMKKQELERMDTNIKTLKTRRAATTDKQGLKDLDATLVDFEKRRAEIAKAANATAAPGSRVFKLDWVAMDATVGDDEPLKAQVLKFEPSYAAPH